MTSTTLSAPRRAALGVALALLIAAPATADVVRWSRLDGAASAGLASGPSTWVAESNVKRTSDLAQEPWWGNDSSWNRYAYVENNPVNASDPTRELAMLGTALIGGLVDFTFQVAINAMEGKTGGELLEGTGKAFVRGAIIGATGYGLARVGGRVLEIGRAVRQAQKARAAAEGTQKLLSAGRQVEAAWGASTYRHGGLMTGMEHIMYRHSAGSGFANVSRFAKGTTARTVKGYVDEALRCGTVTQTGPGAFTVEHALGRTIGTNIAGDAAGSIRVFLRDGIIQSAFPF